MDKLIDRFGRQINYLRISVTDRCNLRCIYCMPAGGIVHKAHGDILSFEEIYKITKVAAQSGIQKIRITGGEPLVRKNLPVLIEKLKGIKALKEIALTTNGVYLSGYAHSLKIAGLDRINISLDSLVPKKFEKATRGGDINAVLEGIESALSNGFSAVKINTVLIKGFNIDEIQAFADLTRRKAIHVRFIEYMPTDLEYISREEMYFSASDAKDICGSLGRLDPVYDEAAATAKIFRIEGFCGTVGFVSPISDPFCSSCNKLRLTSDGRLRSCLHLSMSINLKKAIEQGASEQDLAFLFEEAVAMKPESHNLLERPIGVPNENFSMCQIGG